MKVLIILNEDPAPGKATGGLGVHVGELANQFKYMDDIELTVLGVDYEKQEGGLFVVGNGGIEKVELSKWKHKKGHYRLLRIFNTNDIITRFGFLTKVITDDLFIENALRFLGKEQFDVIHVHDASLWRIAKNLKVLFKSKLVVTSHLSFYLSHPSIPDNPYYMFDAQNEATAYHECDGLITVSQSYKKVLQKEYFLDDINVIYNGVNSDFLESVEYDEALRAKYGDKPLVVFVGRLVPTKGITHIFEAVKKLPGFNFVLIANIAPTLEDVSPLFKETKRMVKEYDNFTWYNYLDQPSKWKLMKVADIGIVPSLHEPFGIVALEWLGLGVPLIVYKTDGLKEFCLDTNSIPIEPKASHLVNAIKGFKRNQDIINKGLVTAQEFNWKRCADKTVKVYEKVVNDG